MINTKEVIKKEKKENTLFEKHRNLLMILKLLDCGYKIYQQHLFEIALKLKYEVYQNHIKKEVYYTNNSLPKAMTDLEKSGFIKRDRLIMENGGKTTGLCVRLMPKGIELLEGKSVKVRTNRNTSKFNHLVLLRGKVLIDLLDFYLKLLPDKVKKQNLLEVISKRYKYNTFLGGKEKYFSCLKAIDCENKEYEKQMIEKLTRATDSQINKIKLIRPDIYTGKEFIMNKEKNNEIKNQLKEHTLYKYAKDKHIYFTGVDENYYYNFVVIDPNRTKTEKSYIDDYINIYNYFDKYMGGSNLKRKINILFIFNYEITKNRVRDYIQKKNNEKMNAYIKNNLNKSNEFEIRISYLVFNFIEVYGSSNVKKENKQLPLYKKYPVKNYDKKIIKKKKIVISNDYDPDDDV